MCSNCGWETPGPETAGEIEIPAAPLPMAKVRAALREIQEVEQRMNQKIRAVIAAIDLYVEVVGPDIRGH